MIDLFFYWYHPMRQDSLMANLKLALNAQALFEARDHASNLPTSRIEDLYPSILKRLKSVTQIVKEEAEPLFSHGGLNYIPDHVLETIQREIEDLLHEDNVMATIEIRRLETGTPFQNYEILLHNSYREIDWGNAEDVRENFKKARQNR